MRDPKLPPPSFAESDAASYALAEQLLSRKGLGPYGPLLRQVLPELRKQVHERHAAHVEQANAKRIASTAVVREIDPDWAGAVEAGAITSREGYVEALDSGAIREIPPGSPEATARSWNETAKALQSEVMVSELEQLGGAFVQVEGGVSELAEAIAATERPAASLTRPPGKPRRKGGV